MNPNDTIAVGDIHGQITLLDMMVQFLKGSQTNVVFVGDLIDRAEFEGADFEVLSLVSSMMAHPEEWGLKSVRAIKGNHEVMFLDAVKEIAECRLRFPQTDLWIRNGGCIHDMSRMEQYVPFLRKLPLFVEGPNDHVIVHAGVHPAKPWADQTQEDLVWIREPFLSSKPYRIRKFKHFVHGHTPDWNGEYASRVENPHFNGYRTCIDTGAFLTGVLTALNLNQGSFHQVTK